MSNDFPKCFSTPRHKTNMDSWPQMHATQSCVYVNICVIGICPPLQSAHAATPAARCVPISLPQGVFERLYYYLQLEEGGPGLTWRRHSIRWVGFPPLLTAPSVFVVPRFWLEIIPWPHL